MKTLPLSQGMTAIVDDEDFEELNKYKWSFHREKNGNIGGYAFRNKTVSPNKRITIKMHRELLHTPPGMEVDHKNGDGLDNRKENLRLATRQQNCANRKLFKNSIHGLKGVFQKLPCKNFYSQIRVNKKIIRLGVFETKEEAHQAYLEAAKKYFGDFANIG